ncbi:type II toxin-antitoxin system RelE/ParE family toxin [Luteibacter sp. dw_328]|uniref:type II toxin-antitoxin system RelE/ParE family toxin n=1 Tax=Luteibacter sp. dw_328 TaxID=2719796 RepID=UPI001BD607EB|nr:type II toxin-antitoxin system RelE/ParE family toxin [Luteibacter sp. dw_328]
MPDKRVDLHLSEDALHDIEAIAAWCESQSAWQAAEGVLLAIMDAIESLVAHPEAGGMTASGSRERVLSAVPYRVVYHFDAMYDHVTVHAAVHTRRQWPL